MVFKDSFEFEYLIVCKNGRDKALYFDKKWIYGPSSNLNKVILKELESRLS